MKDARTIQETRDVVVLCARAFDGLEQINADGRRTWLEMAGLAGLLPAVMAAVNGSGQIIAELKDFDESEMDDLIRAIAPTLNAAVTPAFRRRIDKLLIFLHAGVDLQAEWRGVNPPRPTEIIP